MKAVDVVRKCVRVIDLSRRNENLAVDRSPARSFIHKRNPPSSRSATRERAIYELIHRQADSVSVHVPRLDQHGDGLSIEFFPRAITINELIEDASGFPVEPASAFGTWLGALHTSERLVHDPAPQTLAGGLPWALSIDQPTLELFGASSGATLRLLEIVQQHPDVCEALGDLRAGWHRQTLIHNDLKWDNVLVVRTSSQPDGFVVIDWELAGIGDPRWDVGSIFAAFLGLWGGSIPIMRDAPPDHLIELAERPLNTLQPAAQAFWSAYSRSAYPNLWSAHQDVEPIMRYCGARLIQTAVERAQLRSTLAADSVLLLQIAQNVIEHPAAAATHLLGLSTAEI